MTGTVTAMLRPREFRPVQRQHLGAEAGEHDLRDFRLGRGELRALAHRNARRLLRRVAVDAAADRREGDAARAVRERQSQALAVAGGEQFGLALGAALPYRSDGVNDVFGREAVAARDLGAPGGAAPQRAALGEQFRSGGAVDRAVHAAAAQERVVGGVDDGIYRQSGDVGFDRDELVVHAWILPCPGKAGRVPPFPACRSGDAAALRPTEALAKLDALKLPRASGSKRTCGCPSSSPPARNAN